MKKFLAKGLVMMKTQLAAVCTCLALAPQAQAQLTVCNPGDGLVMLSLSHSERMPDGHYRNRGWLHIEAGKCETFKDVLVEKSHLHYYAEDEVGNVWGDRNSGHRMCVSGSKFDDIYTGTGSCPRDDMVVKGFEKFEYRGQGTPTLRLKGSESRASRQARKIDRLDVGDEVYVQGFLSDELATIVRIEKSDNTVKVRRRSDGTTAWVGVDRIITREENILNPCSLSRK